MWHSETQQGTARDRQGRREGKGAKGGMASLDWAGLETTRMLMRTWAGLCSTGMLDDAQNLLIG